MSIKEKLIIRLKHKPKNFTFKEAETLLLSLGFEKTNAGKTSGSRVAFHRGTFIIKLHKPHPGKELKPYQINQLLSLLESEDLL